MELTFLAIAIIVFVDGGYRDSIGVQSCIGVVACTLCISFVATLECSNTLREKSDEHLQTQIDELKHELESMKKMNRPEGTQRL